MRRAALTKRQTDPRRRRGSNRNICRSSDRYADAGEAENPWIGGLAAQIARALAGGVADIAEDEEIADRGAGKARAVDRLAGPQALHKPSRRAGNRVRLHLRLLDLVGQRRIDADAAIGRKLDKTLRQIHIARAKRRADFALRDVPVENAIKRPIADLDRIIHGEPRACLHAAANDRKRGDREHDGAHTRKGGMAQHGNELFSAQGVSHGANIVFPMRRRIASHLRLFDSRTPSGALRADKYIPARSDS